jgi:hypothetical protein
MSVTYRWENEGKTVIRFIFDEPWTWSEYYEMKPISDKAIAEVGHKVGAIIEIPRNLHLGADALSHALRIDRSKPANLLLMVVVTQSPLYKAFLGLAARVFPEFSKGVKWSSSEEAARRIIEAVVAPDAESGPPKPAEAVSGSRMR